MWVFDATPLIYLGKVDRLGLLQGLEASCVLPERVYEEVVETGIEQGHPDARRIEYVVKEGTVDVVTVEHTPLFSRLQRNDNLSNADIAVLAHAELHDGVAVMDETYGRDVAASEGITTRGTAYLLLKLTKQGAITVEDTGTVIDSMIEAGWYCAPDVYRKIVDKLDSLGT
jgi:predicted nucleic acid-binding protein